jgi:hypothetical protein
MCEKRAGSIMRKRQAASGKQRGAGVDLCRQQGSRREQ